MHKKVWINYLFGHDKTGLDYKIFNTLLDSLGVKELKILKRHDDLIERVSEICKLTKMGLLKTIRNDYKFDIQNCQNGDLWIEAGESIDKLTPDWIKKGQLPYSGWYLTFNGDDNNFSSWARNLLLQEVRFNVWMRYMEYKMDIASREKENTKNPFESEDDFSWISQGFGNYI